MSNSLVLVEHNLDFSNFQDYKNSKFISFDIVAHKKLQNLGITNFLIEDYLSDDDKSAIDQKTIEVCYGWYKQKSISKFLEYDDVNLGWLLEIELFSYVIQAIKKFVGIIKLLQVENPTKVHCSNFLNSMIQEINQNNNLELKIISTASNSTLYFDNVEIPINFRNKSFSIRISRNYAIKFKKIMEIFTNIFFNLKFDLKNLENKKNLLFLDFNPILYKKMFENFSKTDFNILLLNERRPAAWNMSSFKLLKKLNCKIIPLQDLKDDEINHSIEKAQKDFSILLEKIFSNDIHFKNYFSIMGFSFWSSIKDDFVLLCNNRFNEAIERLILSKKLFSRLKIHEIIVLYNTGVEEKAILSQSAKQNISGYLLQHGYLPQGKYVRKYLNSSPIIPTFGLKNAVWGDFTKSLLTDLEVSENKIQVIGSPRHDDFFQAKIPGMSNKILFTESFSGEVDFTSFDSQNDLKNETMIKQMVSHLNDIPEHELIVKLHPGKHSLPYSLKSVIQDVSTTIPIYKSGNIFNFLKDCKLVVASELTTVVIEAMILKIPTMIYLTHPKWNVDEDIFKSKSSIKIENFEQFKSEINQLLNNDEYRNMIVTNGTAFVNEQFHNHGTASKTFRNLF
jgi:hypothetical protein